MFDSKSPFMKIVGYILIGFFALIIIISFGMPDFMSRLGKNSMYIATVNGEHIDTYDFLRYRDTRYRHLRDRDMSDFILNNYIGEVLVRQDAAGNGIKISDDKLVRTVQGFKDFREPGTGKFDYDRFLVVLHQNQMNEADFKKTLSKDLLREQYFWLLGLGITVDDRELQDKNLMTGSKIKVRYASIPNFELKKRNAAAIAVTDQEIDAAMKNQKEVKDPRTDRERVKTMLEDQKLAELKKNLQEKINRLSAEGKSFAEAQALLGGTVAETAVFAVGEQVKSDGKDGKPLPELSDSPVFRETCLGLNAGQTSQLITSSSALYIFSPVIKEFKNEPLKAEKIADLRRNTEYQRVSLLSQNMLKKLNEEAKIVKNLKTN